jgi:hypothetical protein
MRIDNAINRIARGGCGGLTIGFQVPYSSICFSAGAPCISSNVILSGVVNSIHQGGMRREKQNERRRHNCARRISGNKGRFGRDIGGFGINCRRVFARLLQRKIFSNFFLLRRH